MKREAGFILWIGAWISFGCVGAVAQSSAERFKQGDYVEVLSSGSWQACIVSGSYRSGARDYPVSCGTQELFIPADSVYIRSRKPTKDESRIAAETTAALARLSRSGNGLGARYGTREPGSCTSRKEPIKGAPSAQQARDYFICEIEAEGVSSLVLVSNVRVEVAPGRNFNSITDSGHTGIDPKQLVYDIRGGFLHYDCRRAAPDENAFARTHNCSAFQETAAQGVCFRNTFGDWHCIMHDLHADILHPRLHLLPPE